jgi:hypothetical protein
VLPGCFKFCAALAIGEEFVCAMLLVQLLIDDTEDANESVAVEAEQFVSFKF